MNQELVARLTEILKDRHKKCPNEVTFIKNTYQKLKKKNDITTIDKLAELCLNKEWFEVFKLCQEKMLAMA